MRTLHYLAVVILVSGCSSLTSPARMHELDSKQSYWMDYDVTRRGTIVSGANSNWKACAEPAPDAAIGVVAKLEGEADIAGQGSAKAKGELSQSIVNLAEKTQMVLFLRESLFRLCELSINTEITAAQTQALYLEVIKASLELVKKDIAQIGLDKQRLESANQAQFIHQKLSDLGVDSKTIQALLQELP